PKREGDNIVPRTKRVVSLIVLAALCAAGAALAQQKPEEEPGWAKGRPKTDEAQRMAPVPAFPVPTPADQLPVKKFKLPPGFKAEVWASGVLDARGLRQGEKGNIFVSSLFVANKVYVIPEKGKHEAKVIIDKMPFATGIEIHKGSRYLRIRDNKLYYAVGAPCNICDPGEWGKLFRMNLDGRGVETIAAGVRNTVGFD